MNIRDLRYLLAVAEHGHFGRAAEGCGVSQPTLSVQVRKLEELLGTALFERTSKTVTPTVACERLIGHVRAAVGRGGCDPCRGAQAARPACRALPARHHPDARALSAAAGLRTAAGGAAHARGGAVGG